MSLQQLHGQLHAPYRSYITVTVMQKLNMHYWKFILLQRCLNQFNFNCSQKFSAQQLYYHVLFRLLFMNLRKLFGLIKLYSCIQNLSYLISGKTLLRSTPAFIQLINVTLLPFIQVWQSSHSFSENIYLSLNIRHFEAIHQQIKKQVRSTELLAMLRK